MEHNDTVTGEAGQVPSAVREPAATYAADSQRGAVTSSGHTQALAAGRNGGTLHPVRDSASASELARRRWDKASAAARRGLVNAAGQLPDVSRRQPYAVIEYLTEQHTLNAADPSSPSSVASFKAVMGLAYPKPDSVRSVADDARTVAAAAVGAELAQALLAELRELRAGRG